MALAIILLSTLIGCIIYWIIGSCENHNIIYFNLSIDNPIEIAKCKCGNAIYENDNYCRKCGRLIKK